ncbi:MAG: cobaltochelatase subunit CobT, partial [Sphingomicrobium sp.]
MALSTPLDRFRNILSGATRAIARDAEAEVVFASDAGGTGTGKVARVVSPGPSLEPRLVSEARGAADALALRLRHHDPRLHAARAPGADGDGRAVFDALETARVEALGTKAMDGVRANLHDLAEARVRIDAITRARTAQEVPLATAIGLLARERLTGDAPPDAARPGLKLVTPWIEEKAGAELDALALTIDDQAAFATLSRRLLEDLELADAEDMSEQEPDEGGDDDQGDDQGPDESDDVDEEGGSQGGEMEMRSEDRDRQDDLDDQAERDTELDEAEASSGEDGAEQARANPSRRNWPDEPLTDYRPFTTRFDETVPAAELCDEEELTRLRAYLD